MGDAAVQPAFERDVQYRLGLIQGGVGAQGQELARVVGQLASMAEENRRAREAIDNRLTTIASEFSGKVGGLEHRIAMVEQHLSEHSGARSVIAKGAEWAVLAVISIFSALALWWAAEGPKVH